MGGARARLTQPGWALEMARWRGVAPAGASVTPSMLLPTRSSRSSSRLPPTGQGFKVWGEHRSLQRLRSMSQSSQDIHSGREGNEVMKN